MEKKQNQNIRRTLKDFKSSLRSWKIFVEASGKLPQFLNQNLVDDARTVKIFLDDYLAFVKIFYFQFLKLCFETEDIDYETKINKFIDTVQKNLDLLSISPKFKFSDQPSDAIKNILFQFLELLSQCSQPVETTLSKFPVIGDIITNFLKAYLKKFHNIQDQNYNTNQVIQKLAEHFLVEIIEYDNCIQFTDSQIYIYTKNAQEVYMVFIDDSKIQRSAKAEVNNDDEKGSNKSLQKQKYQVISFQAPDIVFDSTGMSKVGKQSKIKICLEDASTRQTFTQTPILRQSKISNQSQQFKQINAQPKYQIKTLFGESQENKPSSILNITKQFTNTFILDNFIVEPYRSKIKQIKVKARNQRKSRQPFFV